MKKLREKNNTNKTDLGKLQAFKMTNIINNVVT